MQRNILRSCASVAVVLGALTAILIIAGCDNDGAAAPDGDPDTVEQEAESPEADPVPDVDASETETETEAETGSESDAEAWSWAPIEAWQRQRAAEYLAYACDHTLNPGDMMSLLAHIECARLLGRDDPPADAAPLDAWDATFAKLWKLEDTSDFSVLRMVNLLYVAEDHPVAPSALWAKLREALFTFKYWYSDPTPEREVDGKKVVDMMWYWSENHILIFRASEFLMGQRYPDQVFAVTGMTGRQHHDRARIEILRWLDERARWGFTEWHSDVYYNWDINPLISLAQWSDDEEIAHRSAMVLDLFLLDMALHLHRGTFGATHGRSYIKDKPAAEKEDTFDTAKFFFEDTELPYNGLATAPLLFARGDRYALPYVIRSIARYDEPMTDRERMNLPVDETPPENWNDPAATPPYGLSYTDEADLPLWWSMSAFIAWPLLPMTFTVGQKYDLWNGQFEVMGMISELVDLTQPVDGIMESVYPYYKMFWKVITSALLKEVHTYTYRTGAYMLSSAQDYRPGIMSNQIHAWQATLSEHALIFTQQPAYLPVKEGDAIPADWNWQKKDEPGPGYWTGDGSLPRIGQHENVAVILYAPQFAPKPLGISQFDYRKETHAYFPHAHFDEVIQDGSWTFGRKDGAYVALYSYQPTSWREGQPEVFQNGGLPFDLVADGAMNAWVVELGDKDAYGSFEAFAAAVLAADIEVTAVPDADADGFDDGFDVRYDSPGQGVVSYGWHRTLTVDGQEREQRWNWRYDNPFVQTTFNQTRYDIANGEHRLLLDFSDNTRALSAAPAEH